MIDQIVHRAEVLTLSADSYRTRARRNSSLRTAKLAQSEHARHVDQALRAAPHGGPAGRTPVLLIFEWFVRFGAARIPQLMLGLDTKSVG